MTDWKHFNDRVEKLLRLNSPAVAVKMIANDEEAPAGYSDPPEPITMCQFVTNARVNGLKLLATPDNILCGIAQGMLGLDAMPNVAPRYAGGRVANEAFYNKILRDMPMVKKGVYRAVALTALESVDFEPDLILFVTDPARMTRLLHGVTYHNGERVRIGTAAEAGTCGEAMGACLATGKPAIGFPCYGTRLFGQVADNELLFALPASYADDFLDGLEKTHARISPYPIKKFLTPPPYPRCNYMAKHLTAEDEAALREMKKQAGHEIEE
jgi:uncharacterized protein (DUF169 family)